MSPQHSSLGKEAVYPQQYDKSVLFRIERCANRKIYGIKDKNLPFAGFDIWNAYEISFLTDKGLPISRVMKMKYSASSPYLVESKSLKLYLNSFNMEKCGKTQADAEEKVRNLIIKDLSELLETEVEVSFFSTADKKSFAFEGYQDIKIYLSASTLEAMEFTDFTENPALLQGKRTNQLHQYTFKSDLLRSNCPVTNQPDWGDLFVNISTHYDIDYASIIAYLVSFRKENHFHEAIAEMIFMRLTEAFQPESLMVAAMYTRRGGIDINPIRTTHPHLIDMAFTDMGVRLGKTLRQ